MNRYLNKILKIIFFWYILGSTDEDIWGKPLYDGRSPKRRVNIVESLVPSI